MFDGVNHVALQNLIIMKCLGNGSEHEVFSTARCKPSVTPPLVSQGAAITTGDRLQLAICSYPFTSFWPVYHTTSSSFQKAAFRNLKPLARKSSYYF